MWVRAGVGGLLVGQQESKPVLFLLESRPGLHWLQVLGLISKTMFWLLLCRYLECHLLPPCRGPGISSPSPKNWGLGTQGPRTLCVCVCV